MRLLAIDTATEYCSVAHSDEKTIIYRGREAPREHAELVLPFVQEILAEAGMALGDLEGLVLGKGPGSFTGVRITASLGQGLAFSQGLPVVGISSLQAMAQQAYRLHDATHVIAAIDARMGEVYVGTYKLEEGLMKQQGEERVLKPEAVTEYMKDHANERATWFGVGTGWVTYERELVEACEMLGAIELSHSVRFPHAMDMLALGLAAFNRGEDVAAESFQVHYVRDEVTWQKLPGRS
ncbi:MAG: tRNA threonylcarbamoyladenosine biosynthesis protein TsaB [Idiomarinaceae bacterium HL-53]|nr:MAG: tRNA threonylcarbamoyladenosine biosynthesis protein TsaB [Idiomarinaceae bacterium HL-53]CUS48588.1 tRNA threonylcarbamoyladenosine biosynthesis protein TsaB [Idiomarinaceae bacterium HL-53]